MTVIYVDVLFVINFFITFLLLLLTGKLLKRDTKLWRYAAASALGGAYALVILVQNLSFAVTLLGKFLAAVLITLLAFGFRTMRQFLKSVVLFFFANLLFLGIMIGLWMLFKPPGVVIRNSTVYFDVSAKVLLLSALVAYVISVMVIRIYNRTTAKKEIYELTVEKNGASVHLFAFADSGNKLTEPFSSYPVIIAKKALFSDMPEERVIPFETVGGAGMLTAFKPDRVIVQASGRSVQVENVYIALSEHLQQDAYSAILNPKLIQ